MAFEPRPVHRLRQQVEEQLLEADPAGGERGGGDLVDLPAVGGQAVDLVDHLFADGWGGVTEPASNGAGGAAFPPQVRVLVRGHVFSFSCRDVCAIRGPSDSLARGLKHGMGTERALGKGGEAIGQLEPHPAAPTRKHASRAPVRVEARSCW